MFFCDACAEKNEWPTSTMKSSGRCEMCGKGAICNDVWSGALPVRKPKPKPKPPEKPDDEIEVR